MLKRILLFVIRTMNIILEKYKKIDIQKDYRSDGDKRAGCFA